MRGRETKPGCAAGLKSFTRSPIWLNLDCVARVISAVPAAHNLIEKDEKGRSKYLGYVIQAGPWIIYHSGDTKLFPGRKFVGANDGGSSTGLLLELARGLVRQPRVDDVYLVWFDGEEAVREQWEGEDNLYGSRHLAAKWKQDGTLARIKALINVDMIGDKSLNIKPEGHSSAALRRLVWSTAKEAGYQAYFPDEAVGPIEDDHIPFLRLGVPALDLIDFDYPPWHTDDDTIDKLSAQSLEIVGSVVAEVIRKLERQ
jgi:Zn-dependent M28 family amino/carboxypeptidase